MAFPPNLSDASRRKRPSPKTWYGLSFAGLALFLVWCPLSVLGGVLLTSGMGHDQPGSTALGALLCGGATLLIMIAAVIGVFMKVFFWKYQYDRYEYNRSIRS